MKYVRTCPICGRKATKRTGKLSFCDDHQKTVRRHRTRKVYKEILVYTIPDTKIGIYGYRELNVH